MHPFRTRRVLNGCYTCEMEFFHVCNRGVEKREVFLDDGDRLRFVHDLYVLNDMRSAPNYIVKERQGERKRDLLVRVHAFCLLPNHYHLLLTEAAEAGISKFMQKLNMGYAKYFNEKYKRIGVLWQGVFKKVPIVRDAHFLYIPYYIHLNALDMKFPEWREGGVTNPREALNYLCAYRWSSFLDYHGNRNFPAVLYMTDLKSVLGTEHRQRGEVQQIITSASLASGASSIEFKPI